jgi:hypothetical protein
MSDNQDDWKLPGDKGYDFSDRHTVPQNPSKASAVIVLAGTAFALAALPGYCLVTSNWDTIVETGKRTLPYLRNLLHIIP